MRLFVISRVVLFAAVATALASPAVAADPTREAAQKLAGSNAKAAVAAADQLADLGPRAAAAVPQLITALRHPDAEVRWHASRALEAIGPAAATAAPALVKALKDKDPQVRAHAAHALGYIGDKADVTITALAAGLTDSDPQVRRASVGAIGRLSPGPKVTIPLMVKVLEDARPEVVLPALQTLAEGGADAVPGLIEALHHKQGRYWASVVLAEIGPPAKAAVPELIKLLDDKELEVRMQAILALGSIGSAAKSAGPAVGKLLNDSTPAIRYAAAFTLGQIGATEALPELVKAEEDKDEFLRMVAAWAVAKLNPDDKPAVSKAIDLIVAALKQDNVFVRRGAARALVELDAPPALVGPPLVAALDDPDPAVQAHVYGAIASLGDEIVPRVAERLHDPATHDKAVRLLGLMGAEAKGAVPHLVTALEKAAPEQRRELLFTLAAIGPDSAAATPALVKALADPDEDLRVSACYALGKIGPAAAAAAPELRKNLDSQDRVIRLVSVWALLRIVPNDKNIVDLAVPLLTKVVEEGETELARYEAAASLGDIGAPAKSAVPALQKALEDESPAVREAAAEALKQIGK